MTLLEKILFLISNSGMSDLEFTQKLGVGKSTVSEWKKGKTHSYKKKVDEIASIFHVDRDFLLSDTPQNANFAKRVKKLRKENELDERIASAIFDIDPQDLYVWETLGIVPKEPTLEKLSAFYNVTKAYLIGDSNERGSKELPLPQKILKELRRNKGLTRTELSSEINMPLIHIILLETNNDIDCLSLEDCIRFSDFYSVSIDYLIGRNSLQQPIGEKENDMLFLFNRLSLTDKIKAQNYMITLYENESIEPSQLKQAK